MAMARASLLSSLWPGCMYIRCCPFFCVALDMYRLMLPEACRRAPG